MYMATYRLSPSLSLPPHPVVWEVLVDNLPHLGLLGVQDVRREVENDVEHGRLRRQCSAAMLRVGVRRYLRETHTETAIP